MNDSLDNVTNAQEMIMRTFSNIENSFLNNGNKILKSWRYTVESIKSNAENGNNLGKNLASHSRIVDLKNGVLLVEADHPGWIQTLKLYQKYILNGLHRSVPELTISSIAFRLTGSKIGLTDFYNESETEKIRSKMMGQFEAEEKIYKKFEVAAENSENQNTQTKELPENLQKLFDRFKSELTNE